MYENKSILALILARGGSKRLPGKNVKSLCGKPMIAWTIEAAKQSQYIDRVIVSTDSEEISTVSKTFGADVPFMRPAELASDTATSIDTVLHTVDWLKEHEKKQYDYLMLLQPTSPLRTTTHIDKAIIEFMTGGIFDSLISFCKWEKKTEWMHAYNSEGFLESCLTLKEGFARDGELQLLMPNGAIYFTKTETFLKEKTFYTKKLRGYMMEASDSADIDTEEDFKLASLLMEQYRT